MNTKHIQPMTAETSEEPFNRAGWIFEQKFDGTRALSYLQNGKLEIIGRSDKELTHRYPEFHDLAKFVDCSSVILDGEIVSLDENDNPNFQDLQSRLNVQNPVDIERLRKSQNLRYYVFDILEKNGESLLKKPLYERKEILDRVLMQPNHIKISQFEIKNGIPLFEKQKELGLEGIMAKNAQSVYQSRRSPDWLKCKVTLREEAVICGFTAPKNSREHFGALVLGMYNEQGRLQYVGKVGTGFTQSSLEQVYNVIAPQITNIAPFSIEDRVTWVNPIFICEAKFNNWTNGNHMRFPVYMGLRDDKLPVMCTL